ncbi:MAG TPA: hypothetical protein VLE74_02790 [Candidatus Saccharimonadales bacterium]|nr:hypothetical protein [Candidatus Saccharimonadales bacterium]
MTESAYDLGDVARQAGRPFAGWLADAAPDVIDFDYGSEDPLIGEVYADTVGYIGFSAMTKLVEIEIRSVQPQDRKGVDQIGQHIDEIQARSAELSVEDFLSPS